VFLDTDSSGASNDLPATCELVAGSEAEHADLGLVTPTGLPVATPQHVLQDSTEAEDSGSQAAQSVAYPAETPPRDPSGSSGQMTPLLRERTDTISSSAFGGSSGSGRWIRSSASYTSSVNTRPTVHPRCNSDEHDTSRDDAPDYSSAYSFDPTPASTSQQFESLLSERELAPLELNPSSGGAQEIVFQEPLSDSISLAPQGTRHQNPPFPKCTKPDFVRRSHNNPNPPSGP